MKKYELTNDSIIVDGRKLFRIKALISFGNVECGDLGGYIEKEENLSHNGKCWVYKGAKVYGDAMVYDNARVSSSAMVFENAMVFESSYISGKSEIYGNAKVYGNAYVGGYTHVLGNARVYGEADLNGDTHICGDAMVFDDRAEDEVTIKKLIEELKKYPEDTAVEIFSTFDCGHGFAGGWIEEIDYCEDKKKVTLLNYRG